MVPPLKTTINQFAQTAAALGKVGLLIAEDEQTSASILAETKKLLEQAKYRDCADYLELMDALSAGMEKIFYMEQGERLDGLVLEIIAEFETGIVSLADRKYQTGLKTAKWNPARVSFFVIMTRTQVENSYPRLFDSIGLVQSL